MSKKVLITGGSRGIGAACVKYFANKGYNVIFTYNKSEFEAEKLSEETGAKCIKCDVSAQDDIKKLKNELSNFGLIDVLVNNAGIAQQKMFCDITEDDWDRMFDTNIKSMFLITKLLVPEMIKNHKGSIVNISSIWGMSGGSCEVHYAASKAAVIGFTNALSDELAPSGIRVNCVAPGVINTDMNKCFDDETMKTLADETPLMRIGTPSEIAETVYFLADSASFITGETIKVSGGF